MPDHSVSIERTLLEKLDRGIELQYLYLRPRETLGLTGPISAAEVSQALWSLIRRGLAYIGIEGHQVDFWHVRLTDVGRAALQDYDINPHDADSYLKRLAERVPALTQLPQLRGFEG